MTGKINRPSGFEFQITRSGDIRIFHHHRLVTTLRGKVALRTAARLEVASEPEQQDILARVTGQYKHGNER